MNAIPNNLANALRAILNSKTQAEAYAAQTAAREVLFAYDAARDNGETFVKVPEQSAHPADVFAVYVESRRDSATDERTREYWHRLLGNVRKAATL